MQLDQVQQLWRDEASGKAAERTRIRAIHEIRIRFTTPKMQERLTVALRWPCRYQDMNTAMPMLLLRIQRPLSFAKQHVRFAHLASNSSKDTASSPSASSAATPSASSSSSAELALPPQVEEEVFLSRYRDPFAHDKPRSKPSYYRSRPSTTPAPTPMRSSAAIREEHRQRDRAIDQQGGKDSPRAKRLEMERLWSGGEASPMIPLSHYTSAKSKRKHALVFPGSGSQYVGQGKFVEDYTAAQSCWEEATDALNGFEAWRRSLRLEDVEGEVGELGKLLEAGYEARRLESSLQQIVFEGPQVSLTQLPLSFSMAYTNRPILPVIRMN